VTLRETEIFRPSKAGAIVGSVHRVALRGQAEGKGANRTARPDHERGSSDPMCRPPLYAGHRGALCLNGQSVPHNRYRRIKLVGLNHQRGSGPNEVRATCSERSEEQSKGLLPDPLAPTGAASAMCGPLLAPSFVGHAAITITSSVRRLARLLADKPHSTGRLSEYPPDYFVGICIETSAVAKQNTLWLPRMDFSDCRLRLLPLEE
jgi:hypothetical protein